jgi:spore coat protein CotH
LRHRRHLTAATALGLLLAGIAAAGFYDVEQVGEVRLAFAQTNWRELLDSLYAAGELGRLGATAWVNGTRFDNVGVRFKGGSSYSPGRRKNPFNIKLDEVMAGQAIEGHGTLRLANVFNDPSFVREALSYEIARMYMPAGRANFVNVYVNDTLIGLYVNDEDPDKRFMRDHYLCGENARFKGRLTDSSQMIGWKYLGSEPVDYRHYFVIESDSGWDELARLFRVLNQQPGEVEAVLNVDQHLWMLAFDALLVNLDAPINMPQNHYLYCDASARFNPIVWDLNESFGVFRNLQGTGLLTVAQMQQLDPFLRSTDTNYPIASKILSDSRRRRMYAAHMKTMVTDVITSGWYRDRAYAMQEIVDAHVQADPNRFYTYNDFLNNVTRSVGSGPLAVVGLTELMNARAAYILAQPAFQATAPVIGSVAAGPEPAMPNSTVQFQAQVSSADSVFVNWRQTPATRFGRSAMLDDGMHGDGAAGDGLYGAGIRVGAGNVEYYVYAENPEAAAFEPRRAERELRTLPVAGSVVINEVLAENVRGQPDPNGQRDDWIELRNTSASAVSLDGYLLTDDSTWLAQWVFPDVEIPAGGYLVVWADGDAGQPGLHASFRLNSAGEMVVLCDPDGRMVDRVVYGPQSADVSFGRYPDGVGSFRPMDPTFAAVNVAGVGVAEPLSVGADRLAVGASPNPFSAATTITYSLSQPACVTVRVHDATGRLTATLVDADEPAGSRQVEFRPTGPETAGGVYFAQVIARTAAGRQSRTTKMVRAR